MLFHMHDHQFRMHLRSQMEYTWSVHHILNWTWREDPMRIWCCVNYVHLLWTRKHIFKDLDSFSNEQAQAHSELTATVTPKVCIFVAPRSVFNSNSRFDYIKIHFLIRLLYFNPKTLNIFDLIMHLYSKINSLNWFQLISFFSFFTSLLPFY